MISLRMKRAKRTLDDIDHGSRRKKIFILRYICRTSQTNFKRSAFKYNKKEKNCLLSFRRYGCSVVRSRIEENPRKNVKAR